jgi:PTH1 family peptidyl-tRNA hydrolase
MLMIVGLGNPGAPYHMNRHNIGFMAVDVIARAHHFGPQRSKFQGHIAEGTLAGVKALILKPQTYMNLSGQSVTEAAKFYKITPNRIVVFHDELDLPPGAVRVKTGGGDAGHNGLKSITQHIGANYRRVRLGIGHPGDRDLVSPYVLGDFAKADHTWLEPLLDALAAEAERLAQSDDAGYAKAVTERIAV